MRASDYNERPMATRKKAASAPRAQRKRTPSLGHAPAPKALFEATQARLLRAIPDAICELNHRNAFELLVATILSAQSTDRMVNSVTPGLFQRWPTPAALAAATQEEVETLIKRTGFFRSKAKAIRGTARMLVELHNGQVPKTLDALIALPGVARKTANVVLGTAFGISEGFVVDTHVSRVALRLKLTSETEPRKIERDLCNGFPKADWVDLSHRVLLHGRYTCLAKKPMCTECPLNELCESRLSAPENSWEQRADSEALRVPRRSV